MDLPTKFTQLESTSGLPEVTIPSNIDPSTISYIRELLVPHLSFSASDLHTAVRSPYNNEGVILRSELDDDGAVTGNKGWTSVETVLVRLDTLLTPHGRFPVYFNWTWPGESGLISRMGYDAVVCVQKYEPWVVETYNTSTRSTSALGIVGAGSTSLSPNGTIRGAPIVNTTRYLNATGKDIAFSLARQISFSQWTKLTTGRGEPYVPSPTVSPVVPRLQHSPDLDLPHRLFLSPKALGLDLRSTPNSLQVNLPCSAHGQRRVTLYRTLWDQDLSSHNRTEMRHSQMPLSSSGY